MEYQPESRVCQNCKNDFTIEPDDFLFYEKIKVPAPTWCWKCRAMRRMSFRNLRYLYERICDATSKKIFTIIPPSAPMPVYNREYWMSDLWDPFEYGFDYNFDLPFFEQYKKLFNLVPVTNMLNEDAINSDYGQAMYVKDCYMCFDSGYNENCAYGVTLQKSKQCFDTINCKQCELCYFNINATSCYHTLYSRNVTSCVNIWFCQECIGCNDCFGCINLRNKSHYIFNEPYTKNAYDKKINELKLYSWDNLENIKKQVEIFWNKNPKRFRHGFKDFNCSGDYIYNSTELRNCFFANGAQNCAHSQSIIYDPIRDSMDVTSSGINIELNYEISGSGVNINNTFFSYDCFVTSFVQYSINCRNSSNLFGCIALRNKKYCIFNKQYTKEEYEKMIPKIKKHMNDMPYIDSNDRMYKYGEFFPPEMSPYGFNESQAYEYFPLSEEEVKKFKFNWRIPNERKYNITIKANNLPQTINNIDDNITREVIQCSHHENDNHFHDCKANCSTAFKITNQELLFYRQMNLPLPRLCFNCRHVERINWRNVPELYKRSCMCDKSNHEHVGNCQIEFETSYAPDRPEIVYCDKCYQQEVY